MTLVEVNKKETVKIVKIGKLSDSKLKKRMLDMGITSGELIKVIRNAPLGDPMQIVVRNFNLALRLEDAKNIEVEEVK